MITYELAKQLKDAGFPGLRDRFPGYEIGKNAELDLAIKNQPFAGVPTLSELIEACMNFYHPSHFNMGGMNTWWAILRDQNNSKALVPVQTGSTPEEAVAQLWLELNKQ